MDQRKLKDNDKTITDMVTVRQKTIINCNQNKQMSIKNNISLQIGFRAKSNTKSITDFALWVKPTLNANI